MVRWALSEYPEHLRGALQALAQVQAQAQAGTGTGMLSVHSGMGRTSNSVVLQIGTVFFLSSLGSGSSLLSVDGAKSSSGSEGVADSLSFISNSPNRERKGSACTPSAASNAAVPSERTGRGVIKLSERFGMQALITPACNAVHAPNFSAHDFNELGGQLAPSICQFQTGDNSLPLRARAFT